VTWYVLITLAILAGPLALSFDRRVAFYSHYRSLLKAIIPVSTLYIIWDVIVTERGHWAFNPAYSGKISLFSLPLGEWLFFIVVPYACLFIYEVVKSYFRSKELDKHYLGRVRAAGITVGILFLLLALIFRDQEYTLLAMLSVSIWTVLTSLWRPVLFTQIHTLWYLLLSTVAFLLINGILTGVPIVTYNPEAIWGIRIITIPLEDLFYNFSLLGLYLTFYSHAEQGRQ
jgi:lycopene cyclase domain-containing protein